MTTTTIRSSREIDAVFKAARRVAHPLVIALISKTPDGRGPSGRVAVIAGRKLGNAVTRNRAKRVLRASISRTQRTWDGFDVLLMARAGTGTAAADEIDHAVASVLARGRMGNRLTGHEPMGPAQPQPGRTLAHTPGEGCADA